MNAVTVALKTLVSAISPPQTRSATTPRTNFTTENTSESSSTATKRIQNPAGGGPCASNAGSMGRIIALVISVRDAQNHVLSRVTVPLSPELLPITRALGRVLAEDLRAPFDVPPTDNSAVDGYAVASGDVPATGTRDLDVVAELPAGAVYDGLLASWQAVRIMTGAPMPRGADTVYPQEVVEHRGSRVD